MNSPDALPGGEVIVYQAPDGQVRVDVRLDRETVGLTQQQMAKLFGRERSVITKHLRNVFKEGELEPGGVRANFAHAAADGKTYQVDHFNLDVIISVGYRVKSLRGTQFRIWATSTLREHLLRGYTLHERRLRERGLGEIEQAVGLLAARLGSSGGPGKDQTDPSRTEAWAHASQGSSASMSERMTVAPPQMRSPGGASR